MPLRRVPVRSRESWLKVLATIRSGHVPQSGRLRMYDGGRGMARKLRRLGVWTPGDRVLDLGCGNGRLALGFVASDAPIVSYLGLDCLADSVAWCRRAFRPWPEFEFRHLDVRNGYYNPAGQIRAEDCTLPVEAASVDCVVCWSLFTHIERRAAAARYLAEIRRVLKSGGRAYTSWFCSPPHAVPSPRPQKTVFGDAEMCELVKEFRRVYTGADNVGTVSGQTAIVLERL